MNKRSVIAATAAHVRTRLEGEGSGHDWWHVYRVWHNARHIGRREGADMFIVELGALLHDIADWKFHGGDDSVGPRVAGRWLRRQGVPAPDIAHVQAVIASVSFKGAGVRTATRSLEGAVVQDADRLDAIGAVGIARAFAYGGHKHRAMHDPRIRPVRHKSFAAYKSNAGPTINHFYEKLLLLKDRMNTPTAKRMAAGRHWYMTNYLRQFFAEWEGRR